MDNLRIIVLDAHLHHDLNDLCASYLSRNERIYYNNDWSKFPQHQLCKIAVTHGWMDLLKYFYKNKQGVCKIEGEWDEMTCALAALRGYLDILKFLRTNHKIESNIDLKISDSNSPRSKIQQWINTKCQNICPWNEFTCAFAAFNGHLDVLKYAHENGCEWDEYTCTCAARNGHLDVLKYAHENGCDWDENTCTCAAENGHLDVLTYAHKNGCEWDDNMCERAALNKHLNILEWTQKNNCDCGGKYH